jgi:hypothetical protein
LARVFAQAGRPGAGAAALASLATAQWPLGVLTTAHVEAVRLACAGGGGAAVDAMLAAPLTAHARDMRLGAGDAFAALAGAGALACGASPPRWAAAAAAYRTCLVLPAASVGEEHAAAVRKLLLAEVLARGPRAALDVPAATAPILAGALDAAAGVKALAAAVARGARRAALDAIVCEHAAALEKEPALVAAVLAHAPRVRLLRLQAVYDRLPLAGPRGAAARADVAEADAVAALDSQLAAVARLSGRLQRADEAFALLPQLHVAAAKSKLRGGAGAGFAAGLAGDAMDDDDGAMLGFGGGGAHLYSSPPRGAAAAAAASSPARVT